MEYNNLFESCARDNITEPFIMMKERIEELGYKFENANRNKLSNVESVIFWNGSHRYRGKNPVRIIKHIKQLLWIDEVKRMAKKPILVLWEGPARASKLYEKNSFSGFDKILTWNDSLVDNKRYIKFHLPIPEKWPIVNEVSFSKKKLLLNISFNKVSKNPNELYSERIKSIQYFDKYYPNEFDLYGYGWNKDGWVDKKLISRYFSKTTTPIFNTFRGSVANKWEVFPNYKFSLCYENIEGVYGYITEKLFDCMRSNCVPIYWGAPNIEDYIDEKAYIDRRKFKSNEELGEFLVAMTENEYNQYLDGIKIFLVSDRFKLFLSTSFVNTIVKTLELLQNEPI